MQGGVAVGLVVLLGVAVIAGGSNSENDKSDTFAQQSSQPKAEPEPAVTPKATAATRPGSKGAEGYKVVHVLARPSGGERYYVLLDRPVNLDSAAFKADVKAIMRQLVSEHGPLYIEVHDSLKSLTTSYKQYGDMSLGRNRTAAEDAEQARHYIAQYLGATDNSLTWFPGYYSGADASVEPHFDCCDEFSP